MKNTSHSSIANKKIFRRGNNLQSLCGPEGIKKCQNILWSDETKINLFGNDPGRNVRRPKRKEFDPHYTKMRLTHNGLGLFFLEWSRSYLPYFRNNNQRILQKYTCGSQADIC